MRVVLGTLEVSDADAIALQQHLHANKKAKCCSRDEARDFAQQSIVSAFAALTPGSASAPAAPAQQPAAKPTGPEGSAAFHVRVAGAVEAALERLRMADASTMTERDAVRSARRYLEDVAGLCGVQPDAAFCDAVPYPGALADADAPGGAR